VYMYIYIIKLLFNVCVIFFFRKMILFCLSIRGLLGKKSTYSMLLPNVALVIGNYREIVLLVPNFIRCKCV